MSALGFANGAELGHSAFFRRTRAKQIASQVQEEWQQAHQPKPQRSPGEIVTNSLGMKFAWIPPGTFLMGSPPTEEKRKKDEFQHPVTLTKGFYMGIYPVTQSLLQKLMGNNPSHFKGDDLPVEQVTWEECQSFCKKLNERDGKLYRLPTEAEWEYACRAGTTTPFYCGETISMEQANYDGNSIYGKGIQPEYQQKTTPVGSFPANEWGLYDMHGNVWEWCADWYGNYETGDIKDPIGPSAGDCRVLHGGSWHDIPRLCRSAARGRVEPGFRRRNAGFRLCFCLD